MYYSTILTIVTISCKHSYLEIYTLKKINKLLNTFIKLKTLYIYIYICVCVYNYLNVILLVNLVFLFSQL